MAKWVSGVNGSYFNLDLLTQLQIQQAQDGKYNLTFWGSVIAGPFNTYDEAISASNSLLQVTA